jgi:hypothetical protein
MKRFWLVLGLLAGAIGGAFGQGVSLPIILQPVTSTVPSIDLNFLASTTALPPGVVFSRASSRSCTNSSGVIVTVTTNNPCLDYNPSTLAYIGLSVEAAATNGSFPSNNWLANQTASATVEGVVQNAATAPDGTATAMALIPGSFSGVHQYFSFQQNGTINTTFTFSVYIKPIGTLFPYVRISLENSAYGANTRNVGFNMATGSVDAQDAGALPTATQLPNGWWRFSVTATSLGTAGNYIFNIKPYTTSGVSNGSATGNSADGVYAWGAQTENGYAPTSLVPTAAAIATRAAEIAYLPVTGIRGVNGNAGTLFAQMTYEAPCTNSGGCYSRWVAFNDGNNLNAGTEWGFATGTAYPTLGGSVVTANAVTGGATTVVTSAVAGNSYRYAMSFNPNTVPSAANGVTAPNDVTGSVPRTLTVLNLSQSQRYQGQASLWFQRVTYIPAFMGAAWVTGKANGSIP